MQHNHQFDFSVARLRQALASAKVSQALERLRLKAGFNPSQPRVPAGNRDGGQWTSGGGGTPSRSGSADRRRASEAAQAKIPPAGSRRTFRDRTGDEPWRSRTEFYRADGSVASQTVENRDGSKIEASQPSRGTAGSGRERSTVELRDGRSFTFETRGDTQRVFDGKGKLVSEALWTPQGPQTRAIVRPASMALQRASSLEAGRALYNWLSTQNTAEWHAVFAFRAWNYEGSSDTELLYSGMRTREEVEAVCLALDLVQRKTNKAVKEARASSSSANVSPAVFGTHVHTILKDKIERLGDPKLRAEESLYKTFEETGIRKGSIRIDVIEELDDGTICLYDIKTGKRGLGMRRVLDFATRSLRTLPYGGKVIVTEIRPFEK